MFSAYPFFFSFLAFLLISVFFFLLSFFREAIAGEHFLYTLGYGQDVDFDLLIQLALQNNGFARKIYETGAVNRELRDVYFEVSRPLLFDIIMEYEEGILQDDTLTRHQFPIYFSGSELVVASKVSPTTTATRLQGTVEANTDTGELSRTTTTDLTVSVHVCPSEKTRGPTCDSLGVLVTLRIMQAYFSNCRTI